MPQPSRSLLPQRVTPVAACVNTALVGDRYRFNAANQRTRTDLADASYWVYQYDTLGQMIGGKRYRPDGSVLNGQDFEYALDGIGIGGGTQNQIWHRG